MASEVMTDASATPSMAGSVPASAIELQSRWNVRCTALVEAGQRDRGYLLSEFLGGKLRFLANVLTIG